MKVIKTKELGFDPCSLNYFSNGEYLAVGGSDKKATMWSREGALLGTIAEQKSWIWSARVRPRNNQIFVVTNDGNFAMYDIKFNMVHGLYQVSVTAKNEGPICIQRYDDECDYPALSD